MILQNDVDNRQTKTYQRYVILFIVFLGVFYLRQHTLGEPLEADEAIYALIAQDWIDGGKPYLTLWDNKPLGTFIIYRVAISLFGYNEVAPKLVATISILITSYFLFYYFACTKAHPLVLFMVMGIWAMSSCLVSCYANGANSEIFILPILVAAFIVLTVYRHRKREDYFWLAVLLLSSTLLIKQVTLPFLIIPFLVISKPMWRNLKVGTIRIVGVVGVIILVHAVAYVSCGYSPFAFIEQFKQNASDISSRADHTIITILKSVAIIPFGPAMQPLLFPVIGTILGFVLTGLIVYSVKPVSARHSWWQRLQSRVSGHRPNRLSFYFILASVAAVALPGSNFPHYYILIIPFVIIGFLEFCLYIPVRGQIIVLSACTLHLVGVTYKTYLSQAPVQISYAKYGSNWFIRDRYIGRELRKRNLTRRRIFVDGTHPGIFFYSQNRPANRYFVAWTHASMGITKWEDIQDELRESPPDACVLLNPLTGQFRTWVEDHYVLVDSIAGARIHLRKELL